MSEDEDVDSIEPDDTSSVYQGPISMDVVGNQTVKAVAIGAHVRLCMWVWAWAWAWVWVWVWLWVWEWV